MLAGGGCDEGGRPGPSPGFASRLQRQAWQRRHRGSSELPADLGRELRDSPA